MTNESSTFTTNAMNANYTQSGTFQVNNTAYTGWGYWQDYYYPNVIRESYPIYIRERSEDKGKQAFEILKHLQDKKLMNIDKVSNFIDAMDILIKIL